MIELVEDRTPQAFRVDIGRNDRWLVCGPGIVVCEVGNARHAGDAREQARRIAAALNMVEGYSVAELEAFVRKGQTFKAFALTLAPEEIEADREATA